MKKCKPDEVTVKDPCIFFLPKALFGLVYLETVTMTFCTRREPPVDIEPSTYL